MPKGTRKVFRFMEVEQGERQATGLAKAPYVIQFVRALLDGGEKVLLFAHHHQVMDAYRDELKTFSPAFITGRETMDQKAHAVERFMEGRTDLCCVSLRAAAGLNLQRATCVVFGELDWSPAVHSQAEDRAHRMADVLYRAWELGCKLDGWNDQFRYDLWMQAFIDCGVNPAFYANRQRGLEELLPWDFIDIGVTKRYLRLEYERALKAQTTRDCRQGCNGCGIERIKGLCSLCG